MINISDKHNKMVKDKIKLHLLSDEIKTIKTKKGECKLRHTPLTFNPQELSISRQDSNKLKRIKKSARNKKNRWKKYKDAKAQEDHENEMVESLLKTMDQGEKEDFRTRPVEPENTVGMQLALPLHGQPHKGKIVEHKKDDEGNDLLVAEFHTGARDVFTYQDILEALKDEKNMQEEAYFTFEEILDHYI